MVIHSFVDSLTKYWFTKYHLYIGIGADARKVERIPLSIKGTEDVEDLNG